MEPVNRRTFLIGSGIALLTAPLAAGAQPAGKLYRIGVLLPAADRNDPDAAQISGAFEQALQGLGWVKDQNLRIEERYTAGRREALAPLAAELVALDVDVLVAWTAAGALAAKQATRTIPIVFLSSGDPIAVGLVPNLAHPGGNITGVSTVASLEEYAKRLELLKEAVPYATRVALLFAPEVGSRYRDPSIRSHRIVATAPAGGRSDLKGASPTTSAICYVGWPCHRDDDVSRDGHDVLAGAGGGEGGSTVSTPTTPRSEIISVADVPWQERFPGIRQRMLWTHPFGR